MSRTIAAERVRLGLTQAELAARIGVAPNTISVWENADEPDISARNIKRLAKVFGTSTDYVLDFKPEPA